MTKEFSIDNEMHPGLVRAIQVSMEKLASEGFITITKRDANGFPLEASMNREQYEASRERMEKQNEGYDYFD
jgi:hypothetical protein